MKQTIYYTSPLKWFGGARGKYTSKMEAVRSHVNYAVKSKDQRLVIGDPQRVLLKAKMADKRVNSNVAWSFHTALPNDLTIQEIKDWIAEIRTEIAKLFQMDENDIVIAYHDSEGISKMGNKHIHLIGANLTAEGRAITVNRQTLKQLHQTLQTIITKHGYTIRKREPHEREPHYGQRLRYDEELRTAYVEAVRARAEYERTKEAIAQKPRTTIQPTVWDTTPRVPIWGNTKQEPSKKVPKQEPPKQVPKPEPPKQEIPKQVPKPETPKKEPPKQERKDTRPPASPPIAKQPIAPQPNKENTTGRKTPPPPNTTDIVTALQQRQKAIQEAIQRATPKQVPTATQTQKPTPPPKPPQQKPEMAPPKREPPKPQQAVEPPKKTRDEIIRQRRERILSLLTPQERAEVLRTVAEIEQRRKENQRRKEASSERDIQVWFFR